jgi:hypothetical protein
MLAMSVYYQTTLLSNGEILVAFAGIIPGYKTYIDSEEKERK